MSKEKTNLLLNSNLEINQTDFGLNIRIETDRLIIRSIREEDFTSFSQLLKNEETMKTYHNGALTYSEVLARFNTVLRR